MTLEADKIGRREPAQAITRSQLRIKVIFVTCCYCLLEQLRERKFVFNRRLKLQIGLNDMKKCNCCD
jgi:hypothetical protein